MDATHEEEKILTSEGTGELKTMKIIQVEVKWFRG